MTAERNPLCVAARGRIIHLSLATARSTGTAEILCVQCTPAPQASARLAVPSASQSLAGMVDWLRAAPPGTLVLASEIAARLDAVPTHTDISAATSPVELMTADAAASRLAMSKQWLYRNAAQFGFVVRVGKRSLRYDAGKIDRWRERRCVPQLRRVA